MTRGIAEQDVFEAADKLLARGERPTIERVRLELGRGSPNTVNRLLDGWWGGLAARMAAKESSKLPAHFQAACERLYERVVADSRTMASQQLESRLAEVEAREQQLLARSNVLSAKEATLSQPMEMLRGDLARANDLVVNLTATKGLLLREIEVLAKNDQELKKQLAVCSVSHSELKKKSAAELHRVRAQWEAQENRWLRQIDSLREDLKLLRSERTAEKRSSARNVAQLENAVTNLKKELAAVERSRSPNLKTGASKTKRAKRNSS